MLEIKEALAKSSGIKLLNHNKNVSIASVYIAKKILNIDDKEIIELVKISGLVHDIGKLTHMFQQILLNNKKTDFENKFRHNEIAWAFLFKYLNLPSKLKKFIINNVYWHHGISNKLSQYTSDEILYSNVVSDDTIEAMKEIVINLLGESYIKENDNTAKSPAYYIYDSDNIHDEYNEKFTLIHTCVISGDRIVSELETEYNDFDLTKTEHLNALDKRINQNTNKDNNFELKDFPYGNENIKRWEKQNEIVDNCGKTTIVKAPAGFGKTLIAMIWLSKDKRKTIIVCPRNVVAKSNYRSIINELKAFNITNVTVELYLTGEVVEKNHNGEGEFNSDIIVTNIDNFESPTYKDNISSRLHTIMSANVVFDEYHEFVSALPLYGNFVNIMRVRHRYCDAKTMLLSATPVDIKYLWDGDENNKTTVLPDDDNHYDASHDKKYIIRVTDGFNYDVKGSDITICNSISEAQYMKHRINSNTLFHSELTPDTRELVYDYIMDNYGKHSNNSENKDSVVSSLITQASLDVSFHKLYDSLLSPETALQRIGRCNRFDSFISKSIYTLFRMKDRNNPNKNSQAELSVLNNFYTRKLSDAWFDEMEQYNGMELTLDEIYKIYNNHVNKFHKERKALFSRMYLYSLSSLSSVYPYKFTKEKDDDVITAGSNKLRSVGSETFYIVKSYNSDEYVGPFTTPIYNSYESDFREDGNTLHRMKQTIKAIVKSGDDRFDYDELTKTKQRFERLSLDALRKYGKKSNTPYIRFDKVYHPDYGVINQNLLNEIQSI